MNHIFNFIRFKKLFVKHTSENYRSYLMSALVLTGILAIWMGFIILTGNGKLADGSRIGSFAVAYILSGTIFTSFVFSDFSHRNKALSVITLPASHFEKFLVGFIYSYFVFTAVYLICFLSIDHFYVQILGVGVNRKSLFNVFPEPSFPQVILSMYTILHSIALFGAIYFRNMHFVKTAFCFFIGLALLCLFHYGFLQTIIPDVNVRFNPPFINGLIFSTDIDNYEVVRLDKKEQATYANFVVFTFTAVLWVASFFQIRERQL